MHWFDPVALAIYSSDTLIFRRPRIPGCNRASSNNYRPHLGPLPKSFSLAGAVVSLAEGGALMVDCENVWFGVPCQLMAACLC